VRFADISVFLLPCFLRNPKILSFDSDLCYLILSNVPLLHLLTFCSNIDYLHFGLLTCRHFLGFVYKVRRRRRSINTIALCSLLLLHSKLNALKSKSRRINSRKIEPTYPLVEANWNGMAHAQKPYFVFRRNGRVYLNKRRGVSSVDYWQPRCAQRR